MPDNSVHRKSNDSHVESRPTFGPIPPAEGRVNVMRHPCLMEDEGRHFFVLGPVPREVAQGFIEAQRGEYFGPGDYYIVPLA